MRLPPDQVERFYAIWKPLIFYVNQKLKVEPDMLQVTLDEPWDARKLAPIRDALWANDPLREAFIAENPASLSAADLALVESWKHRVAGTFYIFRHLKKHSLLIRDKPAEVYAVLGLSSPLGEIVPYTPCLARMVLLPFEDQIIYDSLLAAYNITFGAGIRRSLQETYKDAKERGAIITSLRPRTQSASREETEAEARAVNARVLDAFRDHLYRSGQSPKVVERDVATAAAFGDIYLAGLAKPCSLRDFAADDVRGYLAHLATAGLKESVRKQSGTGLIRFVRFLRDTERMDYDAAEYALDILRGRE
jgi:hypothetical protein